MFNINHYYNFSLHTNPVLGTAFRNCLLVSIMSYQTALTYENIDGLQSQMKGYLPPGTLLDHTKYTYYLFKYRGENLVIADKWIMPESIETAEGLDYTIRIQDATSRQIDLVRDQLSLLGIRFVIEQEYTMSQSNEDFLKNSQVTINLNLKDYSEDYPDSSNLPAIVRDRLSVLNEQYLPKIFGSLLYGDNKIGSDYGVEQPSSPTAREGFPPGVYEEHLTYIDNYLMQDNSYDELALSSLYDLNITNQSDSTITIDLTLGEGFASRMIISPSECNKELLQEIIRLLYENGMTNQYIVGYYLSLQTYSTIS